MSKLLVTIMTLLSTTVAVANVEVSPDRRAIDENGTLRLTIRLDGSGQNEWPDLSPLEHDFEIVSKQSASQLRSINGNVESWTEWILTLRPRRTGTLKIPALTIDGAHSEPIDIEVRPLDAATRRLMESLARFEVEHQPSVVYVQAQITVSRRLVYAEGTQLYGELPGLPSIDGAVVQALGDADHHTELREGQRYGVIEQRFFVFAERSGSLTLPGASITASVVLPQSKGGRTVRRELRVVSAPRTIDVLPIPSGYPANAPWLPARAVEIVEDWPTEGPWAVGDPRTRTLTVRADGAAASRIAPLLVDYPPVLKVYPDAPTLTEQSNATGIVGIRSEAVRLVPTQAGEISLPAVEVVWWNTTRDRLERSHVPARRERTRGASITQAPPAHSTPETTPQPNAPTTEGVTPIATTNDKWQSASSWLIPAIIVVLGIAVAVLRSKLTLRVRRASERAAYRALRRAVRSGRTRAIYDCLAAWLALRHGDHARGLHHFASTPLGSAQLARLDACLFGRTPNDEFDGAELLRAAREHRRRHRAPATRLGLPPLYPERAT